MSATLKLVEQLIAKPSITPEDAGCQELIAEQLVPLGFQEQRLDFADTQNIWLRRGQAKPLFVFLGHTDVVPTGPLEQWHSPPFTPTIRDGLLYGRGAADMKGGIAAFITACQRFVKQHPDHQGSIALMITSDEEGVATNGVLKVIEVLENRNEKIDWCLVGEPSSDKKIGDVIRIGRRGSLSAQLTIHGTQGHVAYPDIAENPIHTFAPALHQLIAEKWDKGNTFFPKTSLQVSNINSGTGAENIIPNAAEILFNLRYSSELDADTIKQRTYAILDKYDFDYTLNWRLSGRPFLTQNGELIDATHRAIKSVMGYTTLNDTGGGTSDGRFIAPTGAQVVELGAINDSIHKINEHINVEDLGSLSTIYEHMLIELLT